MIREYHSPKANDQFAMTKRLWMYDRLEWRCFANHTPICNCAILEGMGHMWKRELVHTRQLINVSHDQRKELHQIQVTSSNEMAYIYSYKVLYSCNLYSQPHFTSTQSSHVCKRTVGTHGYTTNETYNWHYFIATKMWNYFHTQASGYVT